MIAIIDYDAGNIKSMEKALISLGKKELQSIIDDDQGAELGCHFCMKKYFFTTRELIDLRDQALRA